MADRNPHTVEIHFAVSNRISVRQGKNSVSHVGFSIGDTSYNFGRSEGRYSSSITDGGPYVGVRSPYRQDGFYLKLTDAPPVADALRGFVDAYLEQRPDRTTTQLPTSMLNRMWFVRKIGRLSQLNTVKKLSNIDKETYERQAQVDYSLLRDVTFDNYVAFRNAPGPEGELAIIQKVYPFLGSLSLSDYRALKSFNAAEHAELVSVAAALKADLGNRMYKTFLLASTDFNGGEYKMISGENCVKAAFFFLTNGLKQAAHSVADKPDLLAEVKTLSGLVSNLKDAGPIKSPWNAFKKAQEEGPRKKSVVFQDTPEDNIYWRVAGDEAALSRRDKRRNLRFFDRKELVGALVHKTDVTAYEKQGLDYVRIENLSQDMKTKCEPYKGILGIGIGGGRKTRFES